MTIVANMEELDRVVAHCEQLGERHTQDSWFEVDPAAYDWPDDIDGWRLTEDWQCHTTACLAGWTAILHGWRPVGPDTALMWHPGSDHQRRVMSVAREILGLTLHESLWLFNYSSTLADVKIAAERIRAGETSPIIAVE